MTNDDFVLYDRFSNLEAVSEPSIEVSGNLTMRCRKFKSLMQRPLLSTAWHAFITYLITSFDSLSDKRFFTYSMFYKEPPFDSSWIM